MIVHGADGDDGGDGGDNCGDGDNADDDGDNYQYDITTTLFQAANVNSYPCAITKAAMHSSLVISTA